MGVIYRCAIKLHRADRLAIGDGLRGDSCLRCAAGLREPSPRGSTRVLVATIGIASALLSAVANRASSGARARSHHTTYFG
jgi:hypothetical protein